MRRVKALLFLGWMFFLHFFRRLGWVLRGKPEQLKTFLASYRADRILSATPDERAVQLGLQRCTQCGLCGITNPAFARLHAEYYRSPALFASAISRSQPEFNHAVDLLKLLGGQKIDNRICPQEVPLQESVDLIAKKIAELGT